MLLFCSIDGRAESLSRRSSRGESSSIGLYFVRTIRIKIFTSIWCSKSVKIAAWYFVGTDAVQYAWIRIRRNTLWGVRYLNTYCAVSVEANVCPGVSLAVIMTSGFDIRSLILQFYHRPPFKFIWFCSRAQLKRSLCCCCLLTRSESVRKSTVDWSLIIHRHPQPSRHPHQDPLSSISLTAKKLRRRLQDGTCQYQTTESWWIISNSWKYIRKYVLQFPFPLVWTFN